jgi:hypothetical protein
MARKSRSTIERHGLQEFIGHLFESGATYEEIIKHVREARGKTISRSSLSRWRQTWASAEEQIRVAQQDAEAILTVMQAKPDMNFSEPAIAMVLGKMVRRLANAHEAFENLPIDKVATLLAKLARVQQSGQALGIQEKRLELLKQKIAATAKDVADTVKAQGLSDDVAAAIRQKILGVVPS